MKPFRRSQRLTKFLGEFRRRKFALAVPAVVLAVASASALQETPSIYRSTVRMAFDRGNTADLPGGIAAIREQVTNPEASEGITRKYGQLPGLGSNSISTRVTVESLPEPGAFAVSVNATDPSIAQAITAELADKIATRPDTLSSDQQIESLRRRADEIVIQLRALEGKYPSLIGAGASSASSKAPHNSQPSSEALRAQEMTLESLKDQQYKFQQQLAEVERRITTQRQVVEQQKRGSSLRDNPTYAALLIRRTELQGQRDTLVNRQELTDKHPRVTALNDQIAAIDRQIEDLRRQDNAVARQSPEAREFASLESERNRLRIDLEVANRELARRSGSIAQAPVSINVYRPATTSKQVNEYLALQRNYKALVSEREGLEAKSNTSASTIRLLAPANLPDRPLSPNRPLLIGIAAAVGLALGVAFVLLSRARRLNTLQNEGDVQHYTRLTLLGEIPVLSTARERRLAWWRSKGMFVLVAGTSVAAVLVLSRVLIAFEIFRLIAEK